jgi:hypothetical protein
MPAFTSYCWSLGTTSFRTKEFNLMIERQLELLSAFWAQPQFAGKQWSTSEPLQSAYYDFMKSREFVKGDAPNKAKDSREKTSGLVQIGLLDDERKLTDAGRVLLNIAERQDFGTDNQLRIANDSYIYLKQLLKSANPIGGGFVRPYAVTAYVLSKLGSLSDDEFTFLVPLITDSAKLGGIISDIQAIRHREKSIDGVILDTLLGMNNYQEALRLWTVGTVTEDLLCEIGMNRKSRAYDKPYFALYETLKKLIFDRKNTNVEPVLDALLKIKNKPQTYWKQLIFNTGLQTKIKKEKLSALNTRAGIFAVRTDAEYKQEFFKFLHLFKAKATLADYFDLNRRYLKATDTVLFKNGTVEFDTIPKCYFAIIAEQLPRVAFTETPKLPIDCRVAEIIPNAEVDDQALFAKIEEVYGIAVRNVYDVKKFIEDERITRFNAMIDERFPKETLVELLKRFETRDDKFIQDTVTNNASVPTIFEYIVGIIWYNISERRVNILESMNLSLDADLLPKTHAQGGGEDLTYKYEATTDYPKHTLLIEVTLADGTNQRRMEMEPVSRHLGDYLLRNKDQEAYCVFISTFLHINVISDFRGRKQMPYYGGDGVDFVDGLKILPCATKELQTIVSEGITYSRLYGTFASAFEATDAPNAWYKNNIVNAL